MDEREQEHARQALAARLREGWADSKARERLEHPPRWQWPYNGRQTFNLISLAILVALLVPAVLFGFRVADDFNALGTVKSFCAAESTGDFATAYSLLSRRVRSEWTQDQVAAKLQAAQIAGCSNADSFYDTMLGLGKNSNQIQLNMTYSIAGLGAAEGILTLHRDDEGWRVDTVRPEDSSQSLF